MTPDEAFKQLLTGLPEATLGAFAPGSIERWGPPAAVEVLGTEVLPLLPVQQRSRFMDVVLRYRWDNGTHRILLLTEFWSRGRAADCCCTRRI